MLWIIKFTVLKYRAFDVQRNNFIFVYIFGMFVASESRWETFQLSEIKSIISNINHNYAYHFWFARVCYSEIIKV